MPKLTEALLSRGVTGPVSLEICKNEIDTVSNGITDFALQWRNGLGDLLRAVNMTISLLGSIFFGLNCWMFLSKKKKGKVLAVRVYPWQIQTLSALSSFPSVPWLHISVSLLLCFVQVKHIGDEKWHITVKSEIVCGTSLYYFFITKWLMVKELWEESEDFFFLFVFFFCFVLTGRI